jgi:hypothetical protein
MTTTDTENLIKQWGSDPSPQVLADSWVRRRDSFEQERATKAALRDRPDLGWVLAKITKILVTRARRFTDLFRHDVPWAIGKRVRAALIWAIGAIAESGPAITAAWSTTAFRLEKQIPYELIGSVSHPKSP